MMFRLATLIVALAGLDASAQALDTRRIQRTNDILQTQQINAFAFYQGEQITYDVYPRIGSGLFIAPTNSVAIWYMTDSAVSNYYVFQTGLVVGVTGGPIRFTLPSSLSALTSRLYQSFAVLYGGAPTGQAAVVVIDRAQVDVRKNANYSGIYVGPRPPTNTYPLDATTPVLATFWTANAGGIRDSLGVDDATGLWNRITSAETNFLATAAIEAAARAAADAALSSSVASVTANLGTASNALNLAITNDRAARIAADSALSSSVASVTADLGTASNALNLAVTNDRAARIAADAALSSSVAAVTADLGTQSNALNLAITNDRAARIAADSALSSSVASVTADLGTASNALNLAITNDRAARIAADSALSSSVASVTANLGTASNALNLAITNEAAARIAGDAALSAQIAGVVFSGAVSVVTYGGWHSSEFVEGLSYLSIPRASAASNTLVEALDATFRRNFSDSTAIDYDFAAVNLRNLTNAPVIWSVTPTNLASISTNGFVTSIGAGDITVSLLVGASSSETGVVAIISTNAAIDYQVPGPTGWWRRLILTSNYHRVSNAISDAAYSVVDHAATSYVYSSTGILAGVDLSPFPVWQSRYGNRRPGGALITPKHALFTYHDRPNPGESMRFLTTNGVIETRTIVSSRYVETPGVGSDSIVAQLDTPVTNITPISILSPQFTLYAYQHAPAGNQGFFIVNNQPVLFPYYYFPQLVLDQFGRAKVQMYAQGAVKPVEPWLSAWWRQTIIGDSGSPIFLLHGNRPVLMGLITWGSGAPNKYAHEMVNEINAAISNLCSDCGYSLNLYTGFTNFNALVPPVPL